MEAPNVFIYEIDKTGGQESPLGSTTGLVGLAGRGPAFRPTALTNISQFKTYFGDSDESTYLYFATKYFLENNRPVTVVRPLGVNSIETNEFHAGFNDVDNIIAIGLSDENQPMMATIWAKSDITVVLLNSDAHTIYEDFNLTISRAVSDSEAEAIEIFNGDVNFNPASINYISKKINTDVLKFHDYGYVLKQVNNFAYHETLNGTTYELQSPLSSSEVLDYVVVDNLVEGDYAEYDVDYTTPATPWITSQLYGPPSGDNTEPVYHELFRFYSISDGQWANNGIKIYISNIRKSTSTDTEYGTFDVTVRDYNDTDISQIVLEKFIGCSLDPKDKKYILKMIGNKYTRYDFVNEKLLSYGDFENKSSYIYVELNDNINNAPKDALPWGYMNYTANSSGTLFPTPYITQKQQVKGLYTPKKAWGICFETPNSDVSPLFSYRHDSTIDNAFQYVAQNTVNRTPADEKIMFNLSAIKQSDDSDDIRGTTRLRNNSLKKLVYDKTLLTGSSADYASIDALEGTTAAYFGVPMHGGFDALNPFFESPAYSFTLDSGQDAERYSFLGMFNNGSEIPTYEPDDAEWADSVIDYPAGNTEDDNAMIYIFDKAINLITDPTLIDIQTLACPGITNDFINTHAISKVEERGDTLFVVEVCEKDTTAEDTISHKTNIGYDTSYGAAYFPYYKIYDGEKDTYRWIPPSIAALKAFSLTDKIAFPWYASAGLLRGSMPEAIDVAYRSSAPERTDFANAFINPIASFPGEGNVIWGQNTLYSKGGSYLQMLHVRRLVIYAKKAVKTAGLKVVFEPNSAKTWDNFVKQVTPIFSYIQAFQGLANFSVKCDSTLNTQDLINQRKMLAQIIIQPIPDAEIIEIPFIITDNGVLFE